MVSEPLVVGVGRWQGYVPPSSADYEGLATWDLDLTKIPVIHSTDVDSGTELAVRLAYKSLMRSSMIFNARPIIEVVVEELMPQSVSQLHSPCHTLVLGNIGLLPSDEVIMRKYTSLIGHCFAHGIALVIATCLRDEADVWSRRFGAPTYARLNSRLHHITVAKEA